MGNRRVWSAGLLILVLALVVPRLGLLTATASASEQITQRVSVGIEGAGGNGHSPHVLGGAPRVAISAEGRYVAFTSDADNLVEGDTNGITDVFRHDRTTGETIRVSLDQEGGQFDPDVGYVAAGVNQVSMSADGARIAFELRRELGSINDDVFTVEQDVVVRDLTGEVPETIIVPRGQLEVSVLDKPALSGDGRYVAFQEQGQDGAVWRYDLDEGLFEEVVARGRDASVSFDGRYVAFTADLPPPGTDSTDDFHVYRRDFLADDGGDYTQVDLDVGGLPAQTVGPNAISDDGNLVAFFAEDFEREARPGYVRDVAEGVTRPLEADMLFGTGPQLSGDGRFAVFTANAADVGADVSGLQVFVREVGGEALVLASQGSTGDAGNALSADGVLSGDGSIAAFGSAADNLVDADGNESNDVFVRATAEPAIADLSLTVEPAAGPHGIPEIDLDGVDVATLPLFPGELEASPLRASPLRASPLRASPLRASPLRASPLRASPLRASPLRASPLRASPLRASTLPPLPLSSVPLLRDGGWTAVLAGPPATPFAGLPPQSVLLQDVLSLPEGVYDQIDALTLEDIDIPSTPLGHLSLQVFVFGGSPLDALADRDWCDELSTHGYDCTAHGIDESTSTLVDLAFTGAPVDQLAFLPTLLVRDADLTGSPAYDYDVASVDVDATFLGQTAIDDLPSGIVDCSDPAAFDCADADATLGGAVAAGAILDSPDAVLGRILEVDSLVGSLRFGDVVRMLVDPAKLSFEDMPLLPLLLGTPVEGNLIRYTASADVACDQVESMTFEITIPAGFRYQLGSASFTFEDERFDGDDFGDPVEFTDFGGKEAVIVDGDIVQDPSFREPQPQQLTWPVFGFSCSGEDTAAAVQLSFLAQPWVELGTKTADVRLSTSNASAEVLDTAPFAVEDAHEANDAPEDATPVTPGVLYISHLGPGDTVDRFEVRGEDGPLERGAMVTAVLSHLPADFDLRLDGPSSAPLRASPLRASPLRASPLRASPIEDQGLGLDPDGQVIDPDLVEDTPTTDRTLSQSAHRGLETEVVSTVVTAATADEPLTLAVSGYLGESSNQPYTLQVLVEPPPELSCVAQTAFDGAGDPGTLPDPASLDPETRTLVLVNEQRFDALHGVGSTQAVRDAFAGIGDDPDAGPFAILPVDGDADVRASYAAWDADPCEPELANDVVRDVVGVLDGYIGELPDLRFVVLIGDDNILPSLRVPDLVTLANQREYYPEVVFDGVDNPISAAAAFGYVLTDGAYTDLDPVPWLGHELPVPDLAGGRLVETRDEIVGTIERYQTERHLEVDETLLTAYDFLLDGGQDTQDILQGLVPDPADARSLISDDWTKQDLLDELAFEPDVTGVWAHYDHSRLLTAAGDGMPNPTSEIASSTEALAAGLAEGTLYFTLGCNAGLNVPALAWASATPEEAERLRDWAQTVGQLNGSFFGHTGFGYGDDEISAYSERLMTLYAGLLDGSMTVGQAAVEARHAFLAEAAPDVYTSKVVASSTFYGLPFVRVGADGGVAAPPDALTRPPAETSPVATDPLTGLQSTSFDVSPDFDVVGTGRGDYHVASLATGEPEPTLKALYRPVQPAVSLDLPEPPDGLALGDLLVTELSSTEVPLPDPVFVRPTFDLAEQEPEPIVRDVAYPVSLGGPTLAGNLLLHAGQYRREALDQGDQTLYTRIAGQVLYVDPEALPDRPTFGRVEATTFNPTVFEVDVSPADLVLVLYKPAGSADWGSLLLTEVTPGTWTGMVDAEVEEYFVQAVDDGAVGSARGKGHNFQPEPAPDPSGFTFTITGTALEDGWFAAARVEIIPDTPDVPFEFSLNGAPFEPVTGPIDVVATGVNRIDVRGEDGSEGTVFVPVDATPPEIRIVRPADGEAFVVGEDVRASFACTDEGSGIHSCSATVDGQPLADGDPLDTSPGEHTFEVQAVDVAGHETLVQHTYSALYRFEGFFPPVANPPTFNVAQAGSTIPVKFRLLDADDQPVSDTAVVTRVFSTRITCPNASNDVEMADEDATTASNNELIYDEEDEQFVFTWQTSDSWGGTCRELVFEFDDGTTRHALFRFR